MALYNNDSRFQLTKVLKNRRRFFRVSAFRPILSFWECKTKEDRIARNLWLCLVIGLLVSAYLIMLL